VDRRIGIYKRKRTSPRDLEFRLTYWKTTKKEGIAQVREEEGIFAIVTGSQGVKKKKDLGRSSM